MGDFNDDPVSPSFKNYVKATGDIDKVSDETPYFNPMFKMFKNGVASLAYQDAPNLFDQIIYSKNLIGDKERSAQKLYCIYNRSICSGIPYKQRRELQRLPIQIMGWRSIYWRI